MQLLYLALDENQEGNAQQIQSMSGGGTILGPPHGHKVKSIICYLLYAEQTERANQDLSLVADELRRL